MMPKITSTALGALLCLCASTQVIAAGEQVEVIARIARSGQAMGASGDPFGEVSYLVGRDGLVDVVIDRLTP